VPTASRAYKLSAGPRATPLSLHPPPHRHPAPLPPAPLPLRSAHRHCRRVAVEGPPLLRASLVRRRRPRAVTGHEGTAPSADAIRFTHR
jgi:hypothetical protein